MAQKEAPVEIVKKLEGQVDDLLEMYDLAEKLYSYDNVHGGFSLNEDQRRRDAVKFNTSGIGSGAVLAGNGLMGLAFLYLWSRRGAHHLLDFSQVRRCYASSAAAFMVGTSFGSLGKLASAKVEAGGRGTICLNRRVAQNEQIHALLRGMKFHLATRQMGLWDVDPR